MNKIKQNKVTFTLLLFAIAIIFSSLTILSLPVLFNYKSKVTIIENNFYNNFKIYLNSYNNISYKPFPKPHLLVEKASLKLVKNEETEDLIKTSNLKIFISLKDIYLRTFNDFLSTQISDSNINIRLSDIKKIRKHLYQNINKPIIFNNCKVFIKNKKKEVILISPLKKISYKINTKNKLKYFIINGEVFGLKFKSEWRRNYKEPNISFHNINIFNPNIDVNNIFKFENIKKFKGKSEISYGKDKLKYEIQFNNNIINIFSPNEKNSNFNINSKIQLKPFFLEGELTIKNRKVEKIIDNLLFSLLLYNENFLGNISGLLKIKFDELNNKLIKKGEINLSISEKKINLNQAKFNLHKIGIINTNMSFEEDQGDFKFITNNQLLVEDHIEFAKIFQIGSKKIKKIKKINFDLIKKVGETDITIENIKINNLENEKLSKEIFQIKNIQNLRSYIRRVID